MKYSSTFLVIAILLMIFTITGCASVTPQNIERGRNFRGLSGDFDPAKSFEEHSILINLADVDSGIPVINGRRFHNRYGVLPRDFIILQPGSHTFTAEFWRIGTAHTPELRGTVQLTATFEPGQIYVLTGGRSGSDSISYSVANILTFEELPVLDGNSIFAGYMYVPRQTVVNGIHASIQRGLTNMRWQ